MDVKPGTETTYALVWEGGEVLSGIISNLSKKVGIIKRKSYHMVVTNKRLLFSEITKKMLKEDEDALMEETKGKGFFERIGVVMSSPRRIYDRYSGMTPQSILAENPGNFEVDLNWIQSVKIRQGVSYDGSGQRNPDRMLITTLGEKIELTFQQGESSAAAMGTLRQVLGEKVK